MSLAAAFLLAAVAGQAVPAERSGGPDRGAQVETARVQATILRPAVLKAGTLLSGPGDTTPQSQRQSRAGRVTYEFE